MPGSRSSPGWAVTALALSLGAPRRFQPDSPRPRRSVWAALVACGALTRRSRPRPRQPRVVLRETSRSARHVPQQGSCSSRDNLVALLVRSVEPTGVLHPDVWNQWLPKAKILYFFGGLDTGPGGFTSQFNPDYPPLDGGERGPRIPRDRRRARPRPRAASLGSRRCLPPLRRGAPRAAGATRAPLAGARGVRPLARLRIARRILARRRATRDADRPRGAHGRTLAAGADVSLAVLSGLFLTAATATKNEGLMLALIVVISLAATRVGRASPRVLVGQLGGDPRRHCRLALVARTPPRAAEPLLQPVGRTAPHLPRQAARPPLLRASRAHRSGCLTVPLAATSVPATSVLAGLGWRRAQALTVFTASVVVLDTLGFASIYWLSRVDLHVYVDNTVTRIPAFMAVFCGSLLPLLLATSAPRSVRPERADG